MGGVKRSTDGSEVIGVSAGRGLSLQQREARAGETAKPPAASNQFCGGPHARGA